MKATPRSQRSTTVLARFNRLIEELLNGELNRNSFRPWESKIILDILTCNLEGRSMSEVLRRYHKAVQRQLARGSHLPMRFSEYLGKHA